MLFEIIRFGSQAVKDLNRNTLGEMTLRSYVEKHRYSDAFVDQYLVPMGSAIWSTPAGEILDFPARNFLVFFNNHGLLKFTDKPVWKP